MRARRSSPIGRQRKAAHGLDDAIEFEGPQGRDLHTEASEMLPYTQPEGKPNCSVTAERTDGARLRAAILAADDLARR